MILPCNWLESDDLSLIVTDGSAAAKPFVFRVF